MAIFLVVYGQLFPIHSFPSLLVAIIIGAIIYFVVVLKIDASIRTEVKGLLDTMGLPFIS
jgi:hypothetical protein